MLHTRQQETLLNVTFLIFSLFLVMTKKCHHFCADAPSRSDRSPVEYTSGTSISSGNFTDISDSAASFCPCHKNTNSVIIPLTHRHLAAQHTTERNIIHSSKIFLLKKIILTSLNKNENISDTMTSKSTISVYPHFIMFNTNRYKYISPPPPTPQNTP